MQSGDASAWRDNGAFIDPLEWLVFGDGPLDGSTLPDTDFSSILLDLPVGTIDAFGLYTARSGGNLRIDNFQISAESAIPVPAPIWLVGAALIGAGVSRRGKKKA